jgi:hypothetical protein
MAKNEMNEIAMKWAGQAAPICPVMSGQFQAVVRMPGSIVAAAGAESMTTAIPATPCVGILCAMAMKDESGQFAGCGFAPGADLVNLSRQVAGLVAVLEPSRDPRPICTIPVGFDQVVGVMGRQAAAVEKLVLALLERMTSKKARPAG